MTRPALVRILFIAAIAAYPFIVYFGIQYLPPGFFGLVLLVLLALRFGVLLPAERPVLLPVLLVLAAYSLAALVLQSRVLLLGYPALVNLCLCAVFLNSLRQGEPLLLRIVRARGMPVSKQGPHYLYRLTAVWAGFFLLNALISLWTGIYSMPAWTLYNGFLAYLLVALLAGVEYLYRRRYKRRMGAGSS